MVLFLSGPDTFDVFLFCFQMNVSPSMEMPMPGDIAVKCLISSLWLLYVVVTVIT